MQAVMSVMIAFAAFIAMAVLAGLGFAAYKFYTAIKSLRDEMRRMNSSVTGVPVLLEGVKNICVELASNTVKMSGSVEGLKKTLFGGETSEPRRGSGPGFMPYDTDLAEAAYRAHEVEEAEAVVDMEGGRFFVE